MLGWGGEKETMQGLLEAVRTLALTLRELGAMVGSEQRGGRFSTGSSGHRRENGPG